MSLFMRSGLVGVMFAVFGVAFADDIRDLSPALGQSPKALVSTLRECTSKGQIIGFRHPAADYLQAWFDEFAKPRYLDIVRKVREPDGLRTYAELRNARRLVRQVRKLADFHTEQALISMVDATVLKYGDGATCLDVGPRLLLQMAAQRDRAWVWAEAVDRFIQSSEERRSIEYGEQRRVAESLRQVERSYGWFDAYRN